MYYLRSNSRKTRSFYATQPKIGLHNVYKLEKSFKQFKKVQNKKNKYNKQNNKSTANTKYDFVCLGFAGYAVVEKK